MTGDLLTTVVAGARRSAELREAAIGRSLAREAGQRRPRGQAFRASLEAPGYRVIAECKRRSPSRGVLRAQYDPVAIATSYARAGAAALSILTEPTFFDGSIDHLRAVRDAVDVPLLRKDFVVTEFQLVEARAAGADAVLLIVSALGDQELKSLIAEARQLELAALVEVHDGDEFTRARDAGADIIGVNSRNLRTLAGLGRRLYRPRGTSDAGHHCRRRKRDQVGGRPRPAAGARLSRVSHRRAFHERARSGRRALGDADVGGRSPGDPAMTVRVKICGITRAEDAVLAVELGASALGFVFWPSSPRAITPLLARSIARSVPPFVARVGVFVNAPPDEVAAIVRDVDLDAVQLHGDEAVADYEAVGARLIKAVPSETDDDVAARDGAADDDDAARRRDRSGEAGRYGSGSQLGTRSADCVTPASRPRRRPEPRAM